MLISVSVFIVSLPWFMHSNFNCYGARLGLAGCIAPLLFLKTPYALLTNRAIAHSTERSPTAMRVSLLPLRSSTSRSRSARLALSSVAPYIALRCSFSSRRPSTADEADADVLTCLQRDKSRHSYACVIRPKVYASVVYVMLMCTARPNLVGVLRS